MQSTALFKGWKLILGDVKARCLNTGQSEGDIYLKPPQESKMRTSKVLSLIVEAYGVINSNAKWQHKSDQVLINLGLTQSKPIPQLVCSMEKAELIILEKVVNDTMAA